MDILVKSGETVTIDESEMVGVVEIQKSGTLNAPFLVHIVGVLEIQKSGTLNAPKLRRVLGVFDVHAEGELYAPKLEKNNQLGS